MKQLLLLRNMIIRVLYSLYNNESYFCWIGNDLYIVLFIMIK